jgi:hypothetical protein
MGVIMVGRPREFRHRDVVTAIRAAKAAGIDSPSVRIRTPGGTEYFVGGGSVEAPASKVRGKTARDARNSSSVSKGDRAPLAEGGKAHMLGKQAADTAPPGRTAKTKSAAALKEASGGGAARPAKPA